MEWETVTGTTNANSCLVIARKSGYSIAAAYAISPNGGYNCFPINVGANNTWGIFVLGWSGNLTTYASKAVTVRVLWVRDNTM